MWSTPEYYDRALHFRDEDEDVQGHSLVAGTNYGQGSSREHAALAPRFLGLRFVIASSYARLHWQNLANFGVIPLEFADPSDLETIDQGDTLKISDARSQLQQNADNFEVENMTKGETIRTKHTLSDRQVEMILQGGLIEVMKKKLSD